MSPTFSPPVVFDVPRILPETRGVARRAARHMNPLPRGRTVIKVAGVYSTVDNPAQSLLDTATEVYLGGHVYDVTDTVYAALVAAGYTADVTQWNEMGGVWDSYEARTWGTI